MSLRASGKMKEGTKGFKKVRTSVLVIKGEKHKRKDAKGQHCIKSLRAKRLALNEQVFAMAGASEFRPPKQMPIKKLMYRIYSKAR